MCEVTEVGPWLGRGWCTYEVYPWLVRRWDMCEVGRLGSGWLLQWL